jgi:hypothetical protein
MRIAKTIALALSLAIGMAFGAQAQEQKGLDNHVKLDPYYNGLKGKKVVFLPPRDGFRPDRGLGCDHEATGPGSRL